MALLLAALLALGLAGPAGAAGSFRIKLLFQLAPDASAPSAAPASTGRGASRASAVPHLAS